MKRIKVFLLLLATTSLMAQTPEEAVRILENGEGAGIRALSMGQAFVAAADDHSALYWNPAGLSMLKISEIGGGFQLGRLENEATFRGETANENEGFSALTSAGFAYRFPTVRGGLGMAFGYHRVKDYSDFLFFSGYNALDNGLAFDLEAEDGTTATYPYDRNVQQTEESLQKGGLGAWSLGFGLAVSPGLSVGATLSRYTGSSQYDFAFYQDDVDDIYNAYPADIDAYELYNSLATTYRGYGAKVGALFLLNRDIRLGVTVDLPTTLNVRESYTSNDVLYFDNGESSEADLGGGEWEYDVRFPARYSGGVAFDLSSILLSAQVSYCDWSQTRFEVPEGYALSDDYQSLLNDNRLFSNDFRAVLSWGAGGELRLPGSEILLRGGYHVTPSPLKDAEARLDRKTFSAGIGYRLDRMTTLELAVIRSTYERDSEDAYTPGGTSEKITHDKFMAGLRIRLPNW